MSTLLLLWASTAGYPQTRSLQPELQPNTAGYSVTSQDI